LFYQDGQIFFIPAPINDLGIVGLSGFAIPGQGPMPATGNGLLRTDDAQIKLGAAQGSDANAVLFGSGFDGVLRALSFTEVIAQPFCGQPAYREARGDGPLGHEISRREIAGAGPSEAASITR
jgi:hypothetical protein